MPLADHHCKHWVQAFSKNNLHTEQRENVHQLLALRSGVAISQKQGLRIFMNCRVQLYEAIELYFHAIPFCETRPNEYDPT